jgi:predicted DNA binding CopG/RHH family protein
MKEVNWIEEEKELIESVEKDEWKSIKNLEEEKKRYSKIFKASSKQSERVTINLTKKDLRDLKIKASIEGLPYQTLIGSVLHKYVIGKLVEKTS